MKSMVVRNIHVHVWVKLKCTRYFSGELHQYGGGITNWVYIWFKLFLFMNSLYHHAKFSCELSVIFFMNSMCTSVHYIQTTYSNCIYPCVFKRL
jgi:hypothetical protein